jgi:flagellar hook-basal body complex protein FliE
MSPLNAINAYIKPNGMINFMPPVGRAGASAGPIPASELKRLTAASPAQTIDQMKPAAEGSFSNVLGNLVQDVNAKQVAAGDAVKGMLAGDNVSLHQAMIAMEEASVSFQLMAEVRNKLLESYQEIMRMQV